MTKYVAEALGRPYGYYRKNRKGDYDAVIGGIALSSHSPGDCKGTRYCLTECTNKGGGVRVIGHAANNASEMDSALRLVLDALELKRGK